MYGGTRSAAADGLAEALRTGPFCRALRLAIQAAGLTLDRVQAKLAERGTPVSKTALSYWQQGHTQPERAESLRALAQIEDILGLRPTQLSALLGPPRPRGRWLEHRRGALTVDQAWAQPEGLLRVFQQLGLAVSSTNRLVRVSEHHLTEVTADRLVSRSTYLLVLRAAVDDVDRYVGVYHSPVHRADALEIGDLVGCRLGRRRADAPSGFVVYELLLDAPLRAGELAVVQYTLYPRATGPDVDETFRVSPDLRDLTVQVAFDPHTLPVRVRARRQPSVAREGQTTELRLGSTTTARLVELDPRPGIYGIEWEWS